MLKDGKFASDEDRQHFEQLVGESALHLNLPDLQKALDNPFLTWEKWLRNLLLDEPISTYEEQVKDGLRSWLLSQTEPFTAEQQRVVRMIVNVYLSNRDHLEVFGIDRFQQPPFTRLGGYNYVCRIFGEDNLKSLLDHLNTSIFRRQLDAA